MIPHLAIEQGLRLLPPPMNSPEARAMLIAIGLQESRFTSRRQLVGNPPRPIGPAKGFWQFEQGGGCKGVINHQASRYWMATACKNRGVEFTARALWNAIQDDDVLAAAAARLLLFTDPKRLPALGDEEGSWALYIRTWRPGKPHKASWSSLYAQALKEA